MLVASHDIAVANLKQAIALAKSKPGALAIGYGGNATAMHLTSALFLQKAQVAVNLVAYRGTAPATSDVLAGHIQFAVLDIPASLQLIRDGQLTPLGVSSASRVSFLPDVPTLAEAGLPEFDSVGWFGLVAPTGTPRDIIDRLNAAFVKALQDPSVIEKIRALGAEPAPTTPDAFAEFIRSESVKWGKLVAETGMTSD